MSVKTTFENLSDEIRLLSEKIQVCSRKPIVEIRISGDISDLGTVQAQISKISDMTLRCFWKHVTSGKENGSVFMDRPMKIEDEMHKIAKEILGTEEFANFAINELLPLLSKGNLPDANQIISENYIQFKKGVKNAQVS